jgi:hypothetical protein
MSAQNPTPAPQPAVNNPTPGPAPTQAPAPAPLSLEDLVYSLAQSVQGLNATVATLSTSVSIVVGALSRQNGSSRGSVVEKPTGFEGKDSESAWLFRSAFRIWMESNERFFQHWPNGTRVINQAGEELLDKSKMITLALSFMTKDAAVWARPYLEQLAVAVAPYFLLFSVFFSPALIATAPHTWLSHGRHAEATRSSCSAHSASFTSRIIGYLVTRPS